MSVIAKITLIDGSTHEAVLDGDLLQAERDFTNLIRNAEILKVKNPFGTGYICGQYIISFNLFERK
ncbi:hypothetical protein [Psychrobacillus sp. FSL K6-1464]|uniref:hypothetical protein n=1 Tax=Psychrobacillus sp. FSL K6-1464 TaxID=2921545 RepID=UPI0030F82B54